MTGKGAVAGGRSREVVRSGVVAGGIGFAVIGAAALVGIWTRTADLLAAFWPANALLLGLFVRWPSLRNPGLWIGAVAGYLMADLLTGSQLHVTAGLTAANLTGVAVGAAVLLRWDEEDRRLGQPRAVIKLIGVCAVASVAAAVVGVPVGVLYLDFEPFPAALTWFSAEFAAYLGLLPVLLSVPSPQGQEAQWRSWLGPTLSLVPLLLLAVVIGGPGSLAFPLPALLWAALRGNVFQTATLVLAVTAWDLVALGSGLLDIEFDSLEAAPKVSLQIGLALMSVGPLVVAASTAAREELLVRVRELAETDTLTGLRNRGAWVAKASEHFASAATQDAPAALLMLDLDHFKQVNDNHGHAAGDDLLARCGQVLAEVGRGRAVAGRLGGEEFALFAVGVAPDDAPALAEQVRAAVNRIGHDPAFPVSVTVSGGLVVAATARDTDLSALMTRADDLLYEAKRAGRDRIHHEVLAAVPGGPSDSPGDDLPEATRRP